MSFRRELVLALVSFRNAVVVYANPAQTSASVDPYQLPAVVRATQLLSTDIARLPVRVETADGTPVDSPIVGLLEREASRWQSGYDFRRHLTAQALTTGNGIALIRRDGNGDIIELQPFPDGAVTAKMTEEGVVYKVGDVDLASDQILHVGAYPDTANPAWYVSPIAACAAAMALAADEDAAHAGLVRTGSTGKVAISHPGAMSDETVRAIRDSLAEHPRDR